MKNSILSGVLILFSMVFPSYGDAGNNSTASKLEANSVQLLAAYSIQVSGGVFFSGQPSGERFLQNATLVITSTIDNSGVTRNGINPVDVGIFTNASPLIGAAGALYFGTNTSLSSLVGSTLAASAIDISFVRTGNNQILITLDGNAFGLPNSRLSTFNIYNARSSAFTQIQNVLAGNVAITLSNDFSSTNGNIALGGTSGFGGVGITSEYRATFVGRRIK